MDERLPNDGFPTTPPPDNLREVAESLLQLGELASITASDWESENLIATSSDQERDGRQQYRAVFLWNAILVPSGRLLFAADDFGGLAKLNRMHSFLKQWTKSAIRLRDFGQIGVGSYPIRGDNWTCGTFATDFVDLFQNKTDRTLPMPRTELNQLIASGSVFGKVYAIMKDQSPQQGTA